MKLLVLPLLAAGLFAADPPRIEDMRGKTILLFTPHPDDDAICSLKKRTLQIKDEIARLTASSTRH